MEDEIVNDCRLPASSCDQYVSRSHYRPSMSLMFSPAIASQDSSFVFLLLSVVFIFHLVLFLSSFSCSFHSAVPLSEMPRINEEIRCWGFECTWLHVCVSLFVRALICVHLKRSEWVKKQLMSFRCQSVSLFCWFPVKTTGLMNF